MKRLWLGKADAKQFYAIHKDRPFFNDLVDFMVSGPVVVMVLEGANAIAKNRELMGATNQKKQNPEQFALILLIALMPTLCMAAIAPKMPKQKLHFSLQNVRFIRE